MAKTNRFASGDLVSGKKWNGEHFIGVYEHEYDCGDHCIFDGTKHYCIHKKDCHHANEEEEKVIRETILKAMKEAEKASKKAKKVEEKPVEGEELSEEEKLSEEELEQLLTEE
jgi:hypothetical protein